MLIYPYIQIFMNNDEFTNTWSPGWIGWSPITSPVFINLSNVTDVICVPLELIYCIPVADSILYCPGGSRSVSLGGSEPPFEQEQYLSETCNSYTKYEKRKTNMKQRTPSVVNSATTKSPSVIAKSGVTPGACHPIPTQAHVSNSNCIYKEKISFIEGYIKKKKK